MVLDLIHCKRTNVKHRVSDPTQVRNDLGSLMKREEGMPASLRGNFAEETVMILFNIKDFAENILQFHSIIRRVLFNPLPAS